MTTILAMVLAASATAGTHLREVEARILARIIANESARFDIDPAVIVAIIRHESDFRATVVNSETGAVGYMQIMPWTDATAGFDDYDFTDAAVNIFLGVRRLAWGLAKCGGDLDKAISKYGGYGCHKTKWSEKVLATAAELRK